LEEQETYIFGSIKKYGKFYVKRL